MSKAALLRSCLLHSGKCFVSLSSGILICGGNPVLPHLPGISLASCRALQSLRQEEPPGQPRYCQPDKHMAKGPPQISLHKGKLQLFRFLGHPRQT